MIKLCLDKNITEQEDVRVWTCIGMVVYKYM